jgi:hypothetical protein
MIRECSVNGKDEKCVQNFSIKPEDKHHFGDLGVDGRIRMQRMLKKLDVSVLCPMTGIISNLL